MNYLVVHFYENGPSIYYNGSNILSILYFCIIKSTFSKKNYTLTNLQQEKWDSFVIHKYVYCIGIVTGHSLSSEKFSII